MIVLAALFDLGFGFLAEWVAGLMLASPGIVCPLIGFRREKEKNV